jgi:hypothetical protein
MIVKTAILKNSIWLTLPPLIFSVGLMAILPNSLTATQFNEGIPTTLLYSENISRLVVFLMPLLFSIRLTTTTQKTGLFLYLLGVVIYFASYGIQNFYPNSAWSTSALGFTASAYTNAIWMIGLGLLGEKFYFATRLRYQSIFYIAPALIFVALHTTHAALYHQRIS